MRKLYARLHCFKLNTSWGKLQVKINNPCDTCHQLLIKLTSGHVLLHQFWLILPHVKKLLSKCLLDVHELLRM
jgi:hypothetical protein